MRKILISLFIFFSFTANCQIYNDELVLSLPFNGNAVDESGNENNGIVMGATLTTDRFGNKESAFLFDGINDYITITNNNFNPSTNATISFWFSPTNDLDLSSNYQVFFQSDKRGDRKGEFIISFNRTNCYSYASTMDGKINFELQGDFKYNNSENCAEYGLTMVSTKTDYWQANKWYHVVVTIENGIPSHLIKIYINGKLENVQKTSSILFVENQNIHLGRYFSPQHSSMFEGKMDDIKIYKEVLTIDQILKTFSIEEVTVMENNNSEIKILPNPTRDLIKIVFQDSNLIGGSITIQNTNNQIIKKFRILKKYEQIQLAYNLPSGVYFVQFTDNSGNFIVTKKIILH